MTKDELMEIAWRDFILWAGSTPEMIEAYEQSTGCKMLAPPRNALDAMIDKATGAQKESVEAFVLWVTINHWGAHEAPAAYRKAMIAAGRLTAPDWSQLKALVMAQARDARDDGDRVENLVRKAEYASAYADMLRANVNDSEEKSFISEPRPAPIKPRPPEPTRAAAETRGHSAVPRSPGVPMRPITGDCACGRFFVHPKTGRLRVHCKECAAARNLECAKAWNAANSERKKNNVADWYVRARKNNPKWRALNKKRAKAWRAANRQHIRAYNEARA
jgi:hypothetical protein